MPRPMSLGWGAQRDRQLVEASLCSCQNQLVKVFLQVNVHYDGDHSQNQCLI
jgi:hypothetical protein